MSLKQNANPLAYRSKLDALPHCEQLGDLPVPLLQNWVTGSWNGDSKAWKCSVIKTAMTKDKQLSGKNIQGKENLEM